MIFSEPMVTLGRVPSNPTPAWIRITPAIGTYRWSGTTILILAPQPSGAVRTRRATGQRGRVATNAAGHRLGAPRVLVHDTDVAPHLCPLVLAIDRYDQPLVIILKFNQPVRWTRCCRASLSYQPHPFTAPRCPRASARASCARSDGSRVGRKNHAGARGRSSRDNVAVRVTTDWDPKRYRPAMTSSRWRRPRRRCREAG